MKKLTRDLYQEDMSSYFTYSPATGDLIWKKRPREHFKNGQAHLAWNTKYAGRVAGCRHRSVKGGGAPLAIEVTINGRLMLAHRIIWSMVVGPIPIGMVLDHKDGNPWNNRLDNLRLATATQNTHNSEIGRHNTSGFKGVSRYGQTNKWCARITVDKTRKVLGVFESPELAHKAYCEAAESRFGEFAYHGQRRSNQMV